jgi:hypothetical protein
MRQKQTLLLLLLMRTKIQGGGAIYLQQKSDEGSVLLGQVVAGLTQR